jgi:hypothetical protein
MGLLENILSQKMHLSWVEDAKGGREIKPAWYLAIEFNLSAAIELIAKGDRSQ